MAVVYTSIKTTGGWSTNTVQPAWDLLFHLALNALPVCRQFVDVRPAQVTMPGSSITMQVKNNFSQAVIDAAKAALDEETDVDPVQLPATDTVTFTPVERGFANLRTLKLANRSMVPVDPEIARAVGDHCAKVTDEVLQDEMVTGTQVYYGGSATSTATVTAAMTLTTNLLQLAVTKLRANSAAPRDGINYAAVIHPNVSYDLRRETGQGGWLNPMEYGSDQGRLWRGEIGQYQGLRFLENPRTRNKNDGASGAQVYRSFILGREALGEAVVVEPHIVLGPIVDRLGRFRPVGWYGDYDFQVFRDKALVRLETGSAAK